MKRAIEILENRYSFLEKRQKERQQSLSALETEKEHHQKFYEEAAEEMSAIEEAIKRLKGED